MGQKMEFKDQITYIIENFDFDAIIAYLRVINVDSKEATNVKVLKAVANSMLEEVALNGGHREAYNMVAERKGDFIELSFTPQRINALDILFKT